MRIVLAGQAALGSCLWLGLASCRTPSLRDDRSTVSLPAPSRSAAPPRTRLDAAVVGRPSVIHRPDGPSRPLYTSSDGALATLPSFATFEDTLVVDVAAHAGQVIWGRAYPIPCSAAGASPKLLDLFNSPQAAVTDTSGHFQAWFALASGDAALDATLAASPAPLAAISTSSGASVELWELAPPRRRSTIAGLPEFAKLGPLRAQGDELVVLDSHHVYLYDTQTGTPRSTLIGTYDHATWDSASRAVWLAHDGARTLWNPTDGGLAEENEANKVAAVRQRAGAAPRSSACVAGVASAEPPSFALSDGGVVRLGVDGGSSTVLPVFAPVPLRHAEVTPDGAAVFLESPRLGLVRLDASGGEAVGRAAVLPLPYGDEHGEETRDWQWLDDGYVVLSRSASACRLAAFTRYGRPHPSSFPTCGRLTPDGQLMAIRTATGARVVKTADGSTVCAVETLSPQRTSRDGKLVSDAALTADGRTLVVSVQTPDSSGGGASQEITRYDVSRCVPTGAPIGPLDGREWALLRNGEVDFHGAFIGPGATDATPVNGESGSLRANAAAAGFLNMFTMSAMVRRDGVTHRLAPARGDAGAPGSPPDGREWVPFAVSADGHFAAVNTMTELVVWNVDDGRVTARAAPLPPPPATVSLAVFSANLVLAVDDNEATWIILPDAADEAARRDDGGAPPPPVAELHVRLFAPSAAGRPLRLLVDSSDGRIDGDPELVAAARYRVDDKPLSVAQAAGRYGADPRAPQLARVWFAEHGLGR